MFPPLENVSEEGLLAIGGELNIETLKEAYTHGIFPWPLSEEHPLTWFSPDPRGVLYTQEVHLPSSLKKYMSKNSFHVKFNHDFESIINHCASIKRKGEKGTWITQEMISAMINLYNHSHAYCVGVYDANNDLAGGLYGVCFGEIISGESMFHLQDNCSKIALYELSLLLAKNGIPLLDTQMLTPVVESLGGKYIERKKFISHISSLDHERAKDQIFRP